MKAEEIQAGRVACFIFGLLSGTRTGRRFNTLFCKTFSNYSLAFLKEVW